MQWFHRRSTKCGHGRRRRRRRRRRTNSARISHPPPFRRVTKNHYFKAMLLPLDKNRLNTVQYLFCIHRHGAHITKSVPSDQSNQFISFFEVKINYEYKMKNV